MLGLIGKKVGITQLFGEGGRLTPVTAIEVGPCTVVQQKLPKKEGYSALQLGFGEKKPKAVTKALRGHFEKNKLAFSMHLREFRTEKAANFQVGDALTAAGFKEGDVVNVSGISKGRGFQGVMKRHGKHGGPASHGSNFHRRPGSIGMRTSPARVPKNMKLPGHMGNVKVTTKGLEVVSVRPDDNVILVKGCVPGANGGMLLVLPQDAAFAERPELRRAAAGAEESEAGAVVENKQDEAPKDEGAKE